MPYAPRLMSAPLLVAALLLADLSACCPPTPAGPTPAPLQQAFDKGDALAIADALEALIGDGKDTPHDRQLAYNAVNSKEEATAAYAYARAMITGRLVQSKGLTAAFLVREMEVWAQKSRAIDPTFRSGAAARLLGTLYVLAPGSLLKGGDSEKGLEILEKLVKDYPEAPENQLRYAEALIALGDPAPATAPLCVSLAQKARLRKDDQHLLRKLFQDAGSPTCPPAP
jgi:tetratricopeptide (TPR) repeat protein